MRGDKKTPEFKPGKTPHLQYGNEILNGNVPWREIVQDLLAHGYEKQKLALTIGVSKATINRILQGNYDDLFFRAGAGIISVHCKLYPQDYVV